MPYVKVGPRHQITIPQEVRESAGIHAGDLLEIAVRGGRIVITPQQVVGRPAVAKLSREEQQVLRSAQKKIKAIQGDRVHSTGLTQAEADVAARVGLISEDQKWWWLEEWQKGEREVERDFAEGNLELFEDAESFLDSLPS